VTVDSPKVATSSGPLGTVAGVQLSAVFQSLLIGLALQVALLANEWAAIKHDKTQMTGKSLFILRSQQKSVVISRQYGGLRVVRIKKSQLADKNAPVRVGCGKRNQE